MLSNWNRTISRTADTDRLTARLAVLYPSPMNNLQDVYKVPACPSAAIYAVLQLVAEKGQALDAGKETFLPSLKKLVETSFDEWNDTAVAIAVWRYLLLHDLLSNEDRKRRLVTTGDLVPKENSVIYGALLIASCAIVDLEIDAKEGKLRYPSEKVFALIDLARTKAQGLQISPR